MPPVDDPLPPNPVRISLSDFIMEGDVVDPIDDHFDFLGFAQESAYTDAGPADEEARLRLRRNRDAQRDSRRRRMLGLVEPEARDPPEVDWVGAITADQLLRHEAGSATASGSGSAPGVGSSSSFYRSLVFPTRSIPPESGGSAATVRMEDLRRDAHGLRIAGRAVERYRERRRATLSEMMDDPLDVYDLSERSTAQASETTVAGVIPHVIMERSYTAPTNAGHDFTPIVVGESSNYDTQRRASSSRDLITPVPTMNPGSPVRKRRRLWRDSHDDQGIPTSLLATHSTPCLPLTPKQLPSYLQDSRLPIHAVPTHFNEFDKAPRLALSGDGSRGKDLTITFIGDGKGGDADAAAVRANCPVPRSAGVYYYEALVISAGTSGYISVGFSISRVRKDRLVGWEVGSIAWHLDDGFVFEGQGEGTPLGWPKSGTGDTIGSGIDHDGRAFFTKNGELVGYAPKVMDGEEPLYPSIGLRTPRECVTVNFGFSGPFKYDILSHVKSAKSKLAVQVASTTIFVEVDGPPSVPAASAPDAPLTGLKRKWGKEVGKVASAPMKCAPWKSAPPTPPEDVITVATPSRVTKVVQDVDGCLAHSVLDYLLHNGFVGAAKSMRSVLGEQSGVSANERSSPPTDEEIFAKHLLDIRTAIVGNDIELGYDIMTRAFPYHERVPGSRWGEWRDMFKLQAFYDLVLTSWKGGDEVMSAPLEIRDGPLDRGTGTRDCIGVAFKEFLVGSDVRIDTRMDLLLALGSVLKAAERPALTGQQQLLDHAFGLLAYDTLDAVPPQMRIPLTQKARERFAEEVLRRIREERGLQPESMLEKAFKQTTHVLATLGTRGVGSAALVGEDVIGKVTTYEGV